jgi:hypothetical protein
VNSPYYGVMAGRMLDEGLKALPSPTAYLRGLHPCSRVAHRRHAAMAAVGTSSRAPPFSGRATVLVSCLGPMEAQRLVCCPAFQGTSPGCWPQRSPPASSAGRARRRPSDLQFRPEGMHEKVWIILVLIYFCMHLI